MCGGVLIQGQAIYFKIFHYVIIIHLYDTYFDIVEVALSEFNFST